MHPIVQEIRDILDRASITYTYWEHEPGISSEETSAIRGDEYSLSEGGKALIVKADNTFIQVVIPGDKKFSNSKLRKLLQVRQIRFATKEEIDNITNGILPGGIPPFGNLFGLKVIVDKRILANERIVFSCGERFVSIAMASEDYHAIVQGVVDDIAT